MRWVFVCGACGGHWRHRSGTDERLDHSLKRVAVEAELLAWFRRLPGEAQAEAIGQVRTLALRISGGE